MSSRIGNRKRNSGTKTAIRATSRDRWAGLSHRKRLRYRAEYLLFFPICLLVRVIPERAAVDLGAEVGRLAYYLMPRRRSIGRKNLAVAFPDRTAKERRRILIESFRHLGRTAVEFVNLLFLSHEEIRRRVSYAPGSLEQIPRDQGFIFFTGHIGNWELLALAHSVHGSAMHLVVRRIDNPLYNDAVQSLRERGGNIVIERRSNDAGIYELTEHLGKGGVVGLLVDQYTSRKRAVEVPFFGKLALSHKGPALVALRTGAPMVPAFLCRDKERPGHFQIHLHPPVAVDRSGGGASERVHRLTAKLQKAIEEQVRRCPEEWLWIHRRWKKSSEGEELYGESKRRRCSRRVRSKKAAGTGK